MNQALERLSLLVGNDLEKIKDKTILIIGLGGVGGYTVEALTRMGANRLILVDGDIIEKTNINRQLIATVKTLGKKKTEAWKERILKLNPDAEVTLISTFITKEDCVSLFQYPIDYLVDACDTVSVKKELIRNCKEKKIPFITSMGMGNKLDPSQIKVMELSKTTYDPIAKTLRKFVKDEKIKGKIMTVCSTESPIKTGSRVIASNVIVPAIAGLYMADYIWKQILKEEG